MSAFVVDKVHIDLLVTAGLELPGRYGPMSWFYRDPTAEERERASVPGVAIPVSSVELANELRRTLTRGTASFVGMTLWLENVASIEFRYPDTEETHRNYPGPIAFEREQAESYHFEKVPGMVDPLVVLKAISCYEYQSCEHPGWAVSEAAAYCRQLQAQAVRRLPGYEEADGWGDFDRDVFLPEPIQVRRARVIGGDSR